MNKNISETESIFNDLIDPSRKAVEFKKNDYVFKQGDPVKGIFWVKEGLIKISQSGKEQKLVFSRLVFSGDTIGHRSLFIHQEYNGTAEVLSDKVVAYFFTLDEVTKLLSSNQHFARYLISKIATELQRAEQDRSNAKEKTAFERLSELLYEISLNYSEKLMNGNLVFKSEISKINLARILLMANETVVRIMTEMSQEKIIAYENRRIVILDLPKLASLARL
ncbi:MAG: Crp/Fnr family transcriptional regulator [Bacteriovorax sp.]|jgi:CRP-like cAMP-binding protein